MKTFIHQTSWIVVLLLATSLFLIGCGDDETDEEDVLLDEEAVGEGPTPIAVPSAYVFDSRFVEGESSVSYSGQTVRNLLLQDLKVLIDSLGKAGAQPAAVQDMLNLYAYDDSLNLQSLSTAGATPVKESRYSSISTGKNLSGKISGDVVIGYNRAADDLVREWFQVIADNSQDPAKLGTPAVYTDDNGET